MDDMPLWLALLIIAIILLLIVGYKMLIATSSLPDWVKFALLTR